MLDFLYYLCIAPLESAMRAALHAAYALTGSWGESVLLLSLAVNVALIPFYHLAESWQEAERAARSRMEPKLAEIRAVFRGRERDMYVRALYRLHGYSPVLALRTSCGLLIQIPFFFAAYHLLHAAPQLAGGSWLFIRDLSLPDGLIRAGGVSVNLLPFVMTAANLLSAAVYTSRLTRKETVRLYALAALFLTLLYSSSAALLLYWTSNNCISLLKNLIYTRFVYADARAARPPDPAGKAYPAPRRALFGGTIPARADLIPAAIAVAAFAASLFLRKRAGVSPAVLACVATAAGAGLAAFTLRAAFLRGREGLERHLPLFALILAHVTGLGVWKLTSFKRLATTLSWWHFALFALCIGTLAGWAAIRQPLVRFLAGAACFCEARISAKSAPGLFRAAALAMALLVCWYTPSLLYASDPSFFHESLPELAARLTWRGLLFLAAAWAFFHLAHARLRPFLAAATAWTAAGTLLFAFAAAGDYGTMDEFLLTNPGPLKTRLAPLVDALVSLAAGAAVWALLRKRKTAALAALLRGACLALAIMSAWQAVSVPAAGADSPDAGTGREPSAQLPDYTDRFFGFSRQGTNTVVVMLDMFTGSHARAILDGEPALKEALDGFVWYADTVAPGAATLLSIASILGGEDYTPPNVNARTPPSLLKEIHKGFAVLPDIFVPRGYEVSLAGVDHLEPSLFGEMCAAAPRTLVVGQSFATAYAPYWRQRKGLPSILPESRAPFLASVGLFRAAPWALRPHIYFDGSWMNTQTLLHNPSEGPYAMLDLLPEISNAERRGSTLKYFTSMATHYPWRLDADTCMPAADNSRTTLPDGSIAEHRAAERCALRALSRWLVWMKDNGVYDNTQIILLSDHDGGDSPAYGKRFDRLRPKGLLWKPDALLMVKSRDARGTLRVSEMPMSGADVVALICAESGPCPGVNRPDPRIAPPDGRERARTHSAGLASIRRHDKGAFRVETYTVTGSGTDPANWRGPDKGNKPKKRKDAS